MYFNDVEQKPIDYYHHATSYLISRYNKLKDSEDFSDKLEKAGIKSTLESRGVFGMTVAIEALLFPMKK